MSIVLDHLADSDYISSILQHISIEIPLFHIASSQAYNDPLQKKQSYLQTIKYDEAEKLCSRNSNKKITIAIVDSAFEIDHEDLKTNIK